MSSPLRLLLVLFMLAPVLSAQTTHTDITADDLREHVRYLASEELQGRGTGTAGNRKAAEYIAERLKRFGVRPAGENGSYFQAFDFVSAVRLGPANALSIETPGGTAQATVDEDFRPLGFSAPGTATGTLVFAGYGISAPDKNYDDYAGLDVRGKIVVVMRYAPDGDTPRGEFTKHSSFRDKERVAREKGAAALLIITGPANELQDGLITLRHEPTGGTAGIPVISVKRSVLDPAFAAAGIQLKVVQDTIAARRAPRSVVIGSVRVTLTSDVQKVMGTSSNVAGILEGNDPTRTKEVIVLGAHLDHLGLGGPNSMVPDTVAVHHGADDNASGTSGLLELAELYGATGSNKRTYLFLFFSGEELGTLGSQYYVAHPVRPLQQTIAMVNLDMIGRMENRTLNVAGTGTSPVWEGMLRARNADSALVLKFNPEGFGPSDHASFYGRDIPVLFFMTAMHADYHRPSDTWDKIDYAGEERVLRYVDAIVRDLDARPERPAYARVQSAPAPAGGDSRRASVTFGTVPDFGESTTGMKISGVRPNLPAEKAGLKAGDIITKIGTKTILSVYDFMAVLGELKPGDQVDVEYIRDGKATKTSVTAAKRN